METSSFFGFTGSGVSIARYAPKGFEHVARHSDLAPTAAMLKMERERYVPTYQAILDALDPGRV